MATLLIRLFIILFIPAIVHAGSVTVVVGQPVGTVTGTNFVEDANCMGAWYLNADAGTAETDRSGSGNDLTVSASDSIATSATVPSGYSGASRDFEGVNIEYLYIGDGNELDINGADQAISIVCWVNVSSVNTNDDGYQFIVTKWGAAGARQYEIGLDYTGVGTFSLFGGVSSDGTATDGVVASTATNYATGTWYHIALVSNDTDVRLYVNGSLAADALAYTAGIYNATTLFSIGALSGAPTYGEFFGLIDEVAIFNRALSSTEVTGIYTYGISGNKGGSD